MSQDILDKIHVSKQYACEVACSITLPFSQEGLVSGCCLKSSY